MIQALRTILALTVKDLRSVLVLAAGAICVAAAVLLLAHDIGQFQPESSGLARERLVQLLSGVVAMALVAELLEHDRRLGTLRVLRAAPIGTVHALLAKGLTLSLVVSAAFCALNCVDALAPLFIAPATPEVSPFEKLLSEYGTGRMVGAAVSVAVLASAVTSIVCQQALAAVIAGLLAPFLLVLGLTQLADLGGSAAVFGIGVAAAVLGAGVNLLGTALMVLPVAGIYRLRGLGSRSVLARTVLFLTVLPLCAAAPAGLGALRYGLVDESALLDSGAELCSVEASRDGSTIAIVLRRELQQGLFLIDSKTLEVRPCERPLSGLRAFVPYVFSLSIAGFTQDDQRLYLCATGNSEQPPGWTSFPVIGRDGVRLRQAEYAEMARELSGAGFTFQHTREETVVTCPDGIKLSMPRARPIFPQPAGPYTYAIGRTTRDLLRIDRQRGSFSKLPIALEPNRSPKVSPDGRWLMVTRKNGTMTLHSLEDGRSRTFEGRQFFWTRRDLPVLVSPMSRENGWRLIGMDGARRAPGLPAAASITDLDGERWLVRRSNPQQVEIRDRHGALLKRVFPMDEVKVAR